MKITVVGGGAHRVLGIMRAIMAVPNVMNGGEIALYDLNPVRAEAMGRMLLKTPEQSKSGCRITWGAALEESLEGANIVNVILPAADRRPFSLAKGICARHGFISSDNVSPTGAMCAISIAPVLLHIARTMEKICPEAWLVNFVNPVAVISGMINNHTRIRTLGVCQGFTNHLWDIPRIFGNDEQAQFLDVHSAGVNHLSYIIRGTWQGADLLESLRERIGPDWHPPTINEWWDEFTKRNILRSVNRMVRIWRKLGVLVFSSEQDGMDHLEYDLAVEHLRSECQDPSRAQIDAEVDRYAARRSEEDRSFEACLQADLDERFWSNHWKTDMRFARTDEDVIVRITAAIAGIQPATIATSRPNHGAIQGIKDRYVVEYTQTLFGNDIQAAGAYEIPDAVHGITASLSAHQTMLGDALAVDDPKMLAQALLSYPIQPYSSMATSLYRELFEAFDARISAPYKDAVKFL